MMNQEMTTFEYCEMLVADATLVITKQIELIHEGQNIEEDTEGLQNNRDLTNMILMFLDGLHNYFDTNDEVYYRWISEVVFQIQDISLYQLLENANNDSKVTREGFLGLYRHFLEKNVIGDTIRVRNFINDYNKNASMYEGKPIEKILRNELGRYMSEFISG